MTEDTLQPFMEWVQNYPTWTGIIVCIISFSESLVGVGFFVPGVLLMTGIGALVGSGTLPLVETLFWAILGAVIGDGVSFWVGYRYKEHLRDRWPFSKYPQWLNRGQVFFQQHGGTSIILGRFIGPIRPIIPVIAGIMDVKPLTFYFFNIVSAVVWAPLYSLPGYLFGLSLGVLDAKVGKRLVLVIILLGLLLWAMGFSLKYLIRKVAHYIDRYLDHVWQQYSHSPFYRWTLDKRYPEKRGQLGKGICILFLMAAILVIHWSKGLQYWQGIDGAFWQISESLHVGTVAVVSQYFVQMGDPRILAAFVLACSVLFAIFSLKEMAIFWGGMLVLGAGAQAFLSNSFGQLFWMSSPLWATLVLGGGAVRLARDGADQYPYIAATILVLLNVFGALYLGTILFSEMCLTVLYGIVIILICDFYFRSRTTLPWYGARSFVIPTAMLVLFIAMSVVGSWDKTLEQDKHRMSGGQIQVLTDDTWHQAAVSLEAALRYNFWGKPLVDLNVQIALPLDTLEKTLAEKGWFVLPPTSFLKLLQWLSNEPKPNEHPDIPHFNQNKGETIVFVKPTAEGRYALRLWRTNDRLGAVPIYVGTVLAQEWRQPVPLIHVYMANTDYAQAFATLQADLHSFHVTVLPLKPQKDVASSEGWNWEMLLVYE